MFPSSLWKSKLTETIDLPDSVVRLASSGHRSCMKNSSSILSPFVDRKAFCLVFSFPPPP